MFLNKFLRT